MRELTQLETDAVSGAGVWKIFRDIVVGGVGWDAMKAAGAWARDTFIASDGSSGSRYPIEDCDRCS